MYELNFEDYRNNSIINRYTYFNMVLSDFIDCCQLQKKNILNNSHKMYGF